MARPRRVPGSGRRSGAKAREVAPARRCRRPPPGPDVRPLGPGVRSSEHPARQAGPPAARRNKATGWPRQRSRSPRAPYPLRRTNGSTQTCWSWTAEGVQADASALNRITSSSIQSQDRPSSIWLRVRQRKPSVSRRIGSTPSSSSCAAAQAGSRISKSSNVARRSPVPPGSGSSVITKTGWPGRSSRGRGSLDRAAAHSSPTARDSPMSIRGAARATSRAKPPHPRPDGTAFAPT